MSDKRFLDTNVLIYAFAAEDPKGDAAETLMREGGVTSAQVLNEFTNVSRKKLGLEWKDIDARIAILQSLLYPIIPLTAELNESGRILAREQQFAFYDALIVAAAASVGCRLLYSEDMQNGRKIGGLTICNPFA